MGRTARAKGCEASGQDEKENRQVGAIVQEETRQRIKARLEKLPVGKRLPTLKAAIALARKIRDSKRGEVVYVDFTKK